MVVVSFFFALSVLHAQDSSSYSFVVAGHAYGSHDGDNIGLHPALLKRFYSYYSHGDLFVVLNSIEADRTISEQQ